MKKIYGFILILLLLSGSAFSKEYGLVLAGGGGKGAYQIGVWKALNEYGFAQKITAISGTSVGGLNAGLFACESLSRIETIWKTKVPQELWNSEELIDQNGLLRIINICDLRKINSQSYPKVFVTATRAKFWLGKLLTQNFVDYSYRFQLNEETNKEEVKNLLLATSAFPVATSSVLLKDGYYYVDGGVSDNIPVAPLSNNSDLFQIFVVSLDHYGKSLKSQFPDLNLIEIFPSEDLSGSLGFLATADFSLETITKLIDLGYSDTKKIMDANNFYPVSSYWFN